MATNATTNAAAASTAAPAAANPAVKAASVAVGLTAALVLAGCTIPVDGTGDAPSPATSANTGDAGRPTPTIGSDGAGGGAAPETAGVFTVDGVDADLAERIRGIAEEFSGQAAVAFAEPGVAAGGGGAGASESRASGSGPQYAGNLPSDVAWSTSKVPIAIATVRATGAADAGVIAAITESDNAAADAMWAGLGDPGTAAAAADAVLRDGGDPTTTINSRKTRPEFTAFGQTRWSLPDQAAFGANLTCIDGAGPVVAAMGEITASQRYGLGTIGGARFKGGWGPDDTGGYLVRQFGTIAVEAGELGVSIAARPGDGSYESGQAMLTQIAEAIRLHMPAGGTC